MIADTLTQEIAKALKAKDEVRLTTLRMLSSAFNYERIAKQHTLSDEEEIVVVRKEAKKRQEAIQIYEKVGASDKLEREKKELEILKVYLPENIPDSELSTLIDEVIGSIGATGAGDMGKVMGAVMQKVNGRAEGGKVKDLVKSKLA